MTRRYGTAPQRGRRYTRRPGVYAILLRETDVLLTVQAGEEPELQLPGGGIDAGEHPLAALHREVAEETGWTIASPRRLGAFRRFSYMPDYDLWAEKVCTIYLARPARRIGPPTEAGHTALWMPVADAGQVLDDVVGRAFVARLALQCSRLPR